MFRAAAHEHVFLAVAEAMLELVFSGNRLAQRLDALNIGVLGHAFAQRLDGSGFDALRGIEIRLAGGEIDDVNPFSAELAGFGRNRQGHRWFDQVGFGGEICHADFPLRFNFCLSICKTLSGTSPETSPPRLTTSFTRRELV